jgi:hypothetical protein
VRGNRNHNEKRDERAMRKAYCLRNLELTHGRQ